MPARHKMTRTRNSGRFDEKLAGRANRLKTVMLYDDGLPRKQPEKKRRQCWARHMNDIGITDQIPQVNEIRLANNTKREQRIVKFVSRSLRRKGDLEFQIAAWRAQPDESASQRQNKCFDAAYTRRKEMRIDKQLHSRSFCEAAVEVCAAEESRSVALARGPLRAKAISIASKVAAMFRSGDHVCM